MNNNYESYNPYSNMMYQNNDNIHYVSNDDERLIGGGFAFPFLLGGVTGAALAPAFYRPYPYYNNYYYPPYYYNRPFYPRRRWW